MKRSISSRDRTPSRALSRGGTLMPIQLARLPRSKVSPSSIASIAVRASSVPLAIAGKRGGWRRYGAAIIIGLVLISQVCTRPSSRP